MSEVKVTREHRRQACELLRIATNQLSVQGWIGCGEGVYMEDAGRVAAALAEKDRDLSEAEARGAQKERERIATLITIVAISCDAAGYTGFAARLRQVVDEGVLGKAVK